MEWVKPLGGIAAHAAPPVEPAQLDAVDLQLLLLLSQDARISQRSLARELGMSAPAVADRIARLHRQGVIEGYGVRLNWSAMGYPTIAYLTVTAAEGVEQGSIMTELAGLPEVEEVVIVTGGVDMLVRVRVRDHTHLRELLINRVWQIAGIQRTNTSLSVAEMRPKNTASELIADMIRRAGPGR
ncbi:Lrp/AsnC family transcriptional regulator [Kutzneria sp. CA-103260]|uniref:Lrp/AsnC family transcriptional regulator n=1 Tax=Kutzneria sp. CA-103260 TaxID=2802641 RepID=UPI001BA88772|nr:Lrp/AsnC family transcriptional regulator [Kutzneria sp. CA-103260]QUQ66051.1 Leucine-responsive regulatory protein [Kutzneria sp. CA-103260]